MGNGIGYGICVHWHTKRSHFWTEKSKVNGYLGPLGGGLRCGVMFNSKARLTWHPRPMHKGRNIIPRIVMSINIIIQTID